MDYTTLRKHTQRRTRQIRNINYPLAQQKQLFILYLALISSCRMGHNVLLIHQGELIKAIIFSYGCSIIVIIGFYRRMILLAS